MAKEFVAIKGDEVQRAGSKHPKAKNLRPRPGGHMPARRVRPLTFIAKLLLLSALAAGCGLGILFVGYPGKIIFQIGMGLLIAHATELVHQCIHRTATGSVRWDSFLGRLLGLPSGTSFWYYRWFHLWHHRHNGTEQDKESFGYAYQMMVDPAFSKRVVGFIRHLSMVGHYMTTARRMVLAVRGRLAGELILETPEMRAHTARQIQHDYLIMAGSLCAALLLSLLFRTYFVVEVWLIPLLVAWGPSHALIELPEHWGCDRPDPDVFVNTRSIKATRVARWLTNNNCNHVGHHYDMSVPMESLPAFETELALVRPFKYHQESYPRFYLQFLRSLYTGSTERG